MVNIVGPFGAGINPSTTRPADPEPDGASDTWFVPCINGDPNTGTKIGSVWLNKITAQLRRAVRGMGVTEVATDDDMLLKAIQKADRGVENAGEGSPLYKGVSVSTGKHVIRSLKAGSGIALTLVDGDGDDDEVLLSATGGGGGMGLQSIGDGTAIYAGNDGTNHKIRTIKGGGGTTVTLVDGDGDTDEVLVQAPSCASIGDGTPVYTGLVGTTQQFRSIKAGANVSVSTSDGDGDADEIVISSTANASDGLSIGQTSLIGIDGNASGRDAIGHAETHASWALATGAPSGSIWTVRGAHAFANGTGGASSGDIGSGGQYTTIILLQRTS